MGLNLSKINSAMKKTRKISRVTRMVSGIGGAGKVLGSFGNLGSSFDMDAIQSQLGSSAGIPDVSNLMNGKLSGIPGIPSEVSSTINKIQSLSEGATNVFNSGPVKDVLDFCDKAKSGVKNLPGAKEAGKVANAISSKNNEIMQKVSDYAVDKMKISGIEDTPMVKDAISNLKSGLTNQGIDVDKYIEMYKNSQ